VDLRAGISGGGGARFAAALIVGARVDALVVAAARTPGSSGVLRRNHVTTHVHITASGVETSAAQVQSSIRNPVYQRNQRFI
jgi:hypothetical protein